MKRETSRKAFPGQAKNIALRPSRSISLFLLLFFSACKSNNLIQTELYFGLSKKDGKIISDYEWEGFSNTYVSRLFADGSTEIKAQGAWFDTAQKKRIHEPSRQLILLGRLTRKRSLLIDSLRYYYMQLFDQQSVLRVDKTVRSVSF